MKKDQTDHTETGIVHSTIRMLIPIGKHREALEILQAACAQTQFDPNCISTHLYRGVDDVRAIMVEERWTTDEHIMHHLRSEVYRRILLVIEMAEKPPEIFFDVILKSIGMEKIEQAHTRTMPS